MVTRAKRFAAPTDIPVKFLTPATVEESKAIQSKKRSPWPISFAAAATAASYLLTPTVALPISAFIVIGTCTPFVAFQCQKRSKHEVFAMPNFVTIVVTKKRVPTMTMTTRTHRLNQQGRKKEEACSP